MNLQSNLSQSSDGIMPMGVSLVSNQCALCCCFVFCAVPRSLAGHNKSADYWSLGIVIYELLIGHTPFAHRNATSMSLFRKITKSKVIFPSKENHGIEVVPEAENLVLSLLAKNPLERLGSLGGGV